MKQVAAVVRTLMYLAIIVALVAILLPTAAIDGDIVTGSRQIEKLQFAGAALILAGVALALWCAFTFALVGRGTPLPFDPPRRLVLVGPYRAVRNPMAIGTGAALAGVALFYESLGFLVFAALFMIGIHVFVVAYEEPTLEQLFGGQYKEYRAKVNRWIPSWPMSPRPDDRNNGSAV